MFTIAVHQNVIISTKQTWTENDDYYSECFSLCLRYVANYRPDKTNQWEAKYRIQYCLIKSAVWGKDPFVGILDWI